jgi:uncharacterized protein (TIGR02757 family)
LTLRGKSRFAQNPEELKAILDNASEKYNNRRFITDDPISIPHRYSKKEDIEISAFFAAIFSWGQRKTIINKSKEFMRLMEDDPHEFILNHTEKDRGRFEQFKHRTFQPEDAYYYVYRLQQIYRLHGSLEKCMFTDPIQGVENALSSFYDFFFQSPYCLRRNKKHLSNPFKNSSCKRLNMFLRWMVRKDKNAVDLGIWSSIQMSELFIPLDVHVFRVASSLGLIKGNKCDWQTVKQLTSRLKSFDPIDPVKYDFALFGLGVYSREDRFII